MKVLASFLGLILTLTGCSQVETDKPEHVQFFFVADTASGFRLFSEIREMESPEADLATAALSALVSGAILPLDPDYVNLWDSSTSLNSIKISGDEAVVDLDLGKLNVGGEAEARAIDQIVWTLTGINDEISNVSFLVNGLPIESFAGHVDTTQSFSRGNATEVLSSVQISSILQGDILSSPVQISGEACVFEASLSWVLKQNGTLVDEGFLSAEGACPTRSNWTLDLGELSAGSYELEVFETSPKDGSKSAADTKTFVVELP